MNDTGVLVVLVTAPDTEVARRIASRLVEERLAACGNVVPGVTSLFRWEGAVRDEPEVLLVLKTSAGSLERLEARVRELHPYDVPEVLALPAVGGSEAYLDWVRDSVEASS